MPDWGVVGWGETATAFEKLDDLDEGDFYAIGSGTPDGRGSWDNPRLAYVGIAYGQPVVQRIRQRHQSYQHVIKLMRGVRQGHRLFVMVGNIVAASVQRVTRQFVEDVEGVLIYRNKPPTNDRGVNEYRGRHLIVTNTGDFAPLKGVSACCNPHHTGWRSTDEYEEVKRYSRP